LDMLLTSSAQAGGLAGSALSARLAELQARCAVLERQLDTERAQASAANTAHTDEVSRLRYDSAAQACCLLLNMLRM
jgi:hypothetical protein